MVEELLLDARLDGPERLLIVGAGAGKARRTGEKLVGLMPVPTLTNSPVGSWMALIEPPRLRHSVSLPPIVVEEGQTDDVGRYRGRRRSRCRPYI